MIRLRVNERALALLVAGGILVSSSVAAHKLVKKEVYAGSTTQEEYIVDSNIDPIDESENVIELKSITMVPEEETESEVLSPFEEQLNYQYIPAVEATTGVNVRTGPSTEYDVIGGLTEGTKMPLINKYSEWSKIDYFGREAYVCNDYIKDTKMITGTPEKLVYCNQDTVLTDENKMNHDLFKYEVCPVYKEYPDGYLVSANDILGIIPKSCATELTGAYAIVDISNQIVEIYRDNELILRTPCVTGKDASPTTIGCHTIHSEKHHDYLEGPGYRSYVDHFLAFHNGEGLHDASWRQIFGTSGYHESGSHGCVNLPQDIIEEVNNTLDTGDTVIVKH